MLRTVALCKVSWSWNVNDLAPSKLLFDTYPTFNVLIVFAISADETLNSSCFPKAVQTNHSNIQTTCRRSILLHRLELMQLNMRKFDICRQSQMNAPDCHEMYHMHILADGSCKREIQIPRNVNQHDGLPVTNLTGEGRGRLIFRGRGWLMRGVNNGTSACRHFLVVLFIFNAMLLFQGDSSLPAFEQYGNMFITTPPFLYLCIRTMWGCW